MRPTAHARRRTWRPAVLLAVLAAAACGGKGSGEKAPYRVALVVSPDAPDSAAAAAREGAELAVQEVNADTANHFQLVLTVAAPGDCQKLVTADKVEALVGYDAGATRAACSAAAKQAGIPYLAAARAPDDNCSGNFFQIAPIPNQESEAALGYLGQQKAQRIYIAGGAADSARVSTTERGAQALRISVVSTRGAADGVVEAMSGPEQEAFYRRAAAGPRYASLDLGPAAARALPAGVDVVAISDYFPEVQMPTTQQFVAALRAKHPQGDVATEAAALSYDAVRALAAAARAAGATGGAAVIGALPGVKLDGPRGSFHFPPRSHYATVNMFIARVKPGGVVELITYRPSEEPRSNCG